MTEAQKKVNEVAKMDLYELLEVEIEASEKAIVKSYRKKALKFHPDKNPDNPAAVEKFHQLSKALEILTDKAARAAYDKILKGRKAAELRYKELDSKRQKLKDELTERERAANSSESYQKEAEQQLQAEIERLRHEGNRLIEQEQERLRQELQGQKKAQSTSSSSSAPPRLQVKWSVIKNESGEEIYSQEKLKSVFNKYGDVAEVVLSRKKKGSALIEFKDVSAASMAQQYECGLPESKLKVSWLSGQPAPKAQASNRGLYSDKDYESVVMHKLRQAEERKRLIEQMKAEDSD